MIDSKYSDKISKSKFMGLWRIIIWTISRKGFIY